MNVEVNTSELIGNLLIELTALRKEYAKLMQELEQLRDRPADEKGT